MPIDTAKQIIPDLKQSGPRRPRLPRASTRLTVDKTLEGPQPARRPRRARADRSRRAARPTRRASAAGTSAPRSTTTRSSSAATSSSRSPARRSARDDDLQAAVARPQVGRAGQGRRCVRGGKAKTVEVTLGERPDTVTAASRRADPGRAWPYDAGACPPTSPASRSAASPPATTRCSRSRPARGRSAASCGRARRALRSRRGGAHRHGAAPPRPGLRGVRQRAAGRGRRLVDGIGLTMVQLHGDEGPAFCSEVARRTGAQGDQGRRGERPGRHPRAGGLPHRLPPARRPSRRDARRHGGDLRLGARALAALADPARAQRRADARERRRGDRRRAAVRRRHRQRDRGRARASRTPRRSRPSSTAVNAPRAPRSRHEQRRRAPLRPLRRPVRPRDADARAGRARAGLGRRARRRRLPRRSSTCCCATSSGAPRRCTSPIASARSPAGALYLKREDLNHTGAHKINNAIGQALLARRMGKRRIIAETGAGQHGVATATACALMDLECVVYMGVEDIRRQAPNVQRMKLLGATVSPVDAGRAHAEGGVVRGDPRLGRPTSPRRTTSSARRSARRPTRRSCATCSA